MGLFSGRVGNSNSLSGRGGADQAKKTAYVYDIILDDTHPFIKDTAVGTTFIGSIRFRTMDDLTSSDESLPVAHPIDKGFKNLPVKNELVEIYEFSPGFYGYRRIGLDVNPSFTNTDSNIDNSIKPVQQSENTSKDYQSTASTGIAKSSNDTAQNIGYGKYYKPQVGIHKLKLYEGDNTIESRFGQSIRFSGFNNDKNQFSPTLIIRNSESSLNKKLPANKTVEEDINRDGSIIAMVSDQYQLGFQPGTVDDGGKSDFETKPQSFGDYPSKLIGDQILISSGRVIISAKNAEMLFYSKKNYGFISDGGLSIDNKLGIDISVGDNINVVTNDRDIVMFTGNGSIFLGSKELEPIVKGQQLVDILSELIDAITLQQYLTPSGPTKVGPENLSDFGAIKSKLNNILSKLNQTA
jgi:hypothetical protein